MQRQVYAKAGTAADLAFDLDPSSMVLNDAMADRKTRSGPVVIACGGKNGSKFLFKFSPGMP
jgi:hypothetical protein